MNTIGTALRLTVFGASHGPGVGCVLNGLPPGLRITEEMIQEELELRRPVAGIGTPRAEEDKVELLSGIHDGRTTGTPVTMFIRNKDVDSSKYEVFRRIPRPGHADYPAMVRYGAAHDLRGGGQFSGRMTALIVAAGAVARQLLGTIGVRIAAYTQAVGRVADESEHDLDDILRSRGNDVRAADPVKAEEMKKEILKAREEGDSVGGTVRCLVVGLPVGVGEPFFDTIEGEMAKIMFAIPAVKGFEFGAGFEAARTRGSQHNDPFTIREGKVVTVTNNAGGALGGLSTGMPLVFRVAFKPTASISKEQRSVDLVEMNDALLRIEGRHDPCVVPRAVAVVEGASALVIADLCLRGGFIGRQPR